MALRLRRPAPNRTAHEGSEYRRPRQDRQPIPEPGVETCPRIDRDGPADDRRYLLRLRPRLAGQGDDAAVRIDDRGDAHVHRPDHTSPRLDRTEAGDGQVLLVFGRSVEPAVVRDVDDE